MPRSPSPATQSTDQMITADPRRALACPKLPEGWADGDGMTSRARSARVRTQVKTGPATRIRTAGPGPAQTYVGLRHNRLGDRDGTGAHCRCGRGGAERRAASRGRGHRVARYRRVASPYRPSRTPTRGIPATCGEPPRLTRPRAGPGRVCGASGRSRVRGSGPSRDWPPGPRLGTATWLIRPVALSLAPQAATPPASWEPARDEPRHANNPIAGGQLRHRLRDRATTS